MISPLYQAIRAFDSGEIPLGDPDESYFEPEFDLIEFEVWIWPLMHLWELEKQKSDII